MIVLEPIRDGHSYNHMGISLELAVKYVMFILILICYVAPMIIRFGKIKYVLHKIHIIYLLQNI